jgi:TonB family protein
MDRLTKKAVITSSLLHGTLVLLLLVGPAFLPSEDAIEAKQIIDFIPFKTLEASMSGGGNPNVEQTIPVELPKPAPTLASGPAPQPQPQPKPVQRETPKPQEPPKSDPKPAPKEEDTGWKARSADDIKISLKKTTQSSKSTSKPTANTSRNTDAAKALAAAANNIGSKASAPVQIELRGPGGGGIPYAGFNDALVSAYMREWLIPDSLASSSAKVKVTVTLRRDGTVISTRIQSRSGNAELDASVQRALDKVTYVAPFPDSVKDAQKTFWLEFDPRAKRMVG